MRGSISWDLHDSLKLKLERRITMTNIKNVVLVHGAFADGSGWEAVADILKKDGYTVAVVQHPETSYAEDIKYTKALPHSRWTLGKAAPRSSKAYRRPPKGSSPPTMATSTLIRQPSMPISQRTFRRLRRRSWLSRRF
jgi:hypothetical protein